LSCLIITTLTGRDKLISRERRKGRLSWCDHTGDGVANAVSAERGEEFTKAARKEVEGEKGITEFVDLQRVQIVIWVRDGI
jgi:hypothetical protein